MPPGEEVRVDDWLLLLDASHILEAIIITERFRLIFRKLVSHDELIQVVFDAGIDR